MKKQNCKKRQERELSSLRKTKKKKQVRHKNTPNMSQLPVTCGHKEGVLHYMKYKNKQKCIFSEGQWFKPTEFERFGMKDRNKKWRTSILCEGIPLQKLIEDGFLPSINFHKSKVHDKQKKKRPVVLVQQVSQQNYDVCYVCHSGGDLVCCDECPRAFNSHCHLPAVEEDTLGSQWSCTFCVMKNTEDSSQKTQQEVWSSPVSQYTLHCQYLLLHLLHESKTDPGVTGHHENICGPLKLGRVKMNLENNHYQTVREFVSDIEQILNNGDKDSSSIVSRLKQAFKNELETVFNLM